MQILAIEHENTDLAAGDFRPHLHAEARSVWNLYQAGLIRAAFFCPERSAAVLVLECEDLDAANRLLESLPLVQAGLITFELLSLSAYPGFARLFAAEDQSPSVK